jgi:nucleoside-diphosphate-sugar epimerase
VATLLRDVDVVVNATDGANATDGWNRTEEEMTRANLHAVGTLLTALRTLPASPRLVQIGTVLEYGPVPRGTLIDSSITPAPVNAYTRTKLAGSEKVLTAARDGEVDGVVLRLASVTGPHPSPATFLGLLLTRLREARQGGGVEVAIAEATRDFLDVRDAAAAIVAACLSNTTAEAINVGSGVATTVRELVTRFVAVAGVSPDAVREQDTPVRGLGGDWMQVDITHAERALGWRPGIDLTTSLRDTWLAADRGLR